MTAGGQDFGFGAEFLARLVETSRDCIKVLALDGTLLFMNDGGCRLLEIPSLDPYLGQSWLALWTGEGRARAEMAVARARAGEDTSFEAFGTTPRGTAKWWETSLTPMNGPTGSPERILAVSRDISDRKRDAEERAFLARTTDAVTRSLDYRETMRNVVRAAVPFLADVCVLDMVDDELVRRTVWTARADERARVDAVARRVPSAAAVRATTTALDLEVHDAALREGGVRSAIRIPLASPDQMVLGALTLGTLEGRRAYAARDVALASEFALRAVLALQNARRFTASQTAGRAKDEFLATLSHELRNPLAAIVNAVASLDRIGTRSSAAHQARAVITRQTDHLAGMLDDLLDVARIGQGKVELQLEAVDFATVVQRALEADRHRFERKRQSVSVTMPSETVAVRGDVVRLRQIVTNLLNNASKYTPVGGAIAVQVLADGDEAELRVRDNGRGIPPDKLGAIFELFAQIEPTAGRTEGGLGIGLTLVRRLAALHGGSVTAVSEGEGKGSEFIVRVPRIAQSATAHPASAPPVVAPTRMLLIEDNADARDVLAMTLELEGHTVFVAGSAADGIAAALEHRPPVVIVDIGLPDADGYEVARQLRAKLGADVVLVAFSGYGQAEDRRRSRDAGFDLHVVKPVAPESLLAQLGARLPHSP